MRHLSTYVLRLYYSRVTYYLLFPSICGCITLFCLSLPKPKADVLLTSTVWSCFPTLCSPVHKLPVLAREPETNSLTHSHNRIFLSPMADQTAKGKGGNMEKGSKGHSKGHESKGGSMGVDAGLVDTTHIEPLDDSSTQKGSRSKGSSKVVETHDQVKGKAFPQP